MQPQHARTTQPQQCQDSEGCPAPAAFTYVWPGTKDTYAGCTRHAYKAAAVVGNMGQTLELVPIGGGPAVTIGGGPPASPAAPAPASSEQIHELEGELDEVRKRVSALEPLERSVLELRTKIEALERAGMARTVTNPST